MRHIYIHVPFCRRRCSYCDFSIAVRKSIPHEAFVNAISRELSLRLETNPGGPEGLGGPAGPVETLYLGGGTPSLLAPSSVTRIIAAIESWAGGIDPGGEVTLEANPDDVTARKARHWREAGVNRISLGVQSFDDKVLRWMHRTHGAGSAREAVQILRQSGFESISLDLIFALPPELGRNWDRDLECALSLEPQHISVYGLTVHERTPLARWIGTGRTNAVPDTSYESEFLAAHQILQRAGYRHYEVSNYARPGCESRHNTAYWTGAAYLGLGPSAHSFDGSTRSWNESAWAKYRKLVESGTLPQAGVEELTPEQVELEEIYLGLRRDTGIPTGKLPAGTATWLRDLLGKRFAVSSHGSLRLTAAGWLRLDEVVTLLTT